jgi:hypothetical protein
VEDDSSLFPLINKEGYPPEIFGSKYPLRSRVFAFLGGDGWSPRGRCEWFVGLWRLVVRREWAGVSGDGSGRNKDGVDATPMELGSRSKSEDIEVEAVWGG